MAGRILSWGELSSSSWNKGGIFGPWDPYLGLVLRNTGLEFAQISRSAVGGGRILSRSSWVIVWRDGAIYDTAGWRVGKKGGD